MFEQRALSRSLLLAGCQFPAGRTFSLSFASPRFRLPDVLSVHQDDPTALPVKPKQQPHDRALAAAAASDDSQCVASRNLETHVVQNDLAAVAERDILELDDGFLLGQEDNRVFNVSHARDLRQELVQLLILGGTCEQARRYSVQSERLASEQRESAV